MNPLIAAALAAPMNAATVRQHCLDMDRLTPSRDARRAMAELAIKYGNVTECGRDEWRRYLSTFK